MTAGWLDAAPATRVPPKSGMEMGNHDAKKISAGIRTMAHIVRRSTPDSKALGRTAKLPLKNNSDELSNLNKILDRLCQIQGTHRDCWVFKQSGRLNAEHKGLDTPSESDETQKQRSGNQKTFPLKVKTVNSLHAITRSAAPAIPGHRPQTGDRTHQNSL